MTRRLPPLNAVKAFEAAARHLSFKRAADELCVTPAAVSQQVKSLEDYLDIKLFKREPKGLLLTEAAQRCLPDLRDGFDKVASAMEKALPGEAVQKVNVMVSPSFASKWLVPRLDNFHAAFPSIQIRVSCVLSQVSLNGSDGDVAVVYDFENARRPDTELIMSEEITPVWSPALAGRDKIRSPKDLSSFTLIHDENMARLGDFPRWTSWLSHFDLSLSEFEQGPRLPLSSMAIDAAISGQGVALGRSVLVNDALQSGHLVEFTEKKYPAKFGYFIERHPQGRRTEESETFVRWLRSAAAQDQDSGPTD